MADNNLIIRPGFFQSEAIQQIKKELGDEGIVTYIKMRSYILQSGVNMWKTEEHINKCAKVIRQSPEVVGKVLEIIWPYRDEINRDTTVINISPSIFI